MLALQLLKRSQSTIQHLAAHWGELISRLALIRVEKTIQI